jgi:putative toxin-antitoxin system antitoxin component (TIGR02293 family)
MKTASTARPATSTPDFAVVLTQAGPTRANARRELAAAVQSGKAAVAEAAAARAAGDIYSETFSLLGGRRFWSQHLHSDNDVHTAILKGVAFGSLLFFLEHNIGTVDEEDVAKVLGVSTRTLRRQAETPDKAMPTDLASKTWQLAETLAKASEVFGGKEAAQRWLSAPAVALNGSRPIDLLQTLQGAGVVSDYLDRLEHGVYS